MRDAIQVMALFCIYFLGTVVGQTDIWWQELLGVTFVCAYIFALLMYFDNVIQCQEKATIKRYNDYVVKLETSIQETDAFIDECHVWLWSSIEDKRQFSPKLAEVIRGKVNERRKEYDKMVGQLSLPLDFS